jgi:hypothetical protein
LAICGRLGETSVSWRSAVALEKLLFLQRYVPVLNTEIIIKESIEGYDNIRDTSALTE